MRHEQKKNIVYCCSSRGYGQERGEISKKMIIPKHCIAADVTNKDGAKFPKNDNPKALQLMLRAETGRSPKRNTAQGNTLGTSVPTIQRAVSATGASEILVRSFLLLFQSANYLIHCYPGRCPGLISYWAFSPSLQRANPLFKVKQQNFKRNEAAEVIFLIIATE